MIYLAIYVYGYLVSAAALHLADKETKDCLSGSLIWPVMIPAIIIKRLID